jgi:oxygen-dependent protoporphyrinogen oxidase
LIDLPDGFVLMRATKLWPMMTTPLLSLPGKLRFLWERWIGLPSASAADNDVSVAEFVRRRLGDEVLQNIVGPLVAGIYTADVEKLSMEATMGPMANMVRQHGSLAKATTARRRTGQDKVERGSSGARYERFRAFAGGMICLIDALAQSLPAGSIRTRAAVDAVKRSDSQWEVRDVAVALTAAQ